VCEIEGRDREKETRRRREEEGKRERWTQKEQR
jgi:hypothetical protein